MPGGLTPITQDSFAGGMYQALDTQRIPADGAYEIINGLLDQDAGVVYRRGGGKYLGAGGDASSGSRIWALTLAAGQRTIWADSGITPSRPRVLADDDLSSSLILTGAAIDNEPGVGHGVAWFPVNTGTAPTIYGYAGYRGVETTYSTGTVAVATGSAVVTGTGTTWTSNVKPGYIIWGTGQNRAVAVQSVDSNTQITLTAPWDGTTGTGLAYIASSSITIPVVNFAGRSSAMYATVAGNKLVLGCGSQVVFASTASAAREFSAITTNEHQLPGGAQIRGLAAVRDTAMVFTDKGIFTISNLALDLTDATGNPQQRLDLHSSEVVLRGHHGIASWKNALIVPATDAVYLIDGTSSPVPISRKIQSLYRAFTSTPTKLLGQAVVYKGHYLLPVTHLDSSLEFVSDATLVCNLDDGTWTEVSGSATQSGGCVSFARRIVATAVPTVTERVLGVSSTALFDCSGWWTPTAANKNEADGSTHTFSLTTRDYSTSNVRALFKKLRLWTEGIADSGDTPTLTAGYAEGPAGTSMTPLTGTVGTSTGDAPAGKWDVNAGGRRVRFQIASSSPWASLKIKALDVFVRPKGRA